MFPVLAFEFMLDVVSLQAANANADMRIAATPTNFLLIASRSPHYVKKRIASFTVSRRSHRPGLRLLRRSFALPFLVSPALGLLRAPRGRSIRGHDRPPTYQVQLSPCLSPVSPYL